ncbi:MAG: pre-peptidase C-terminal domain-containing protein [Ardenticatenaceae bacterium]|nr:pre-peptidase C-terminal domain-containing protein [Ardenticatenaceae bacterium]
MADHTINPYVGPRTFEEDDAQFFFGRDREARELLSLVISEPLVLFYAQSGAGKSSLINTKLIPGLRQEGFVVLPVSRVGGELPAGIGDVENVFAFNLLLSLNRDAGVDVGTLTQTTISDYLQARKERDLANYQPVKLDDDDDDWEDDEEPARVLIIDQFEEIVTTHLSRWTERKAFFEQLSDAMRDDPLLWVVLSLREDFVAALDPFARLLPNRLRQRFHMERMGASAARQAVEQPAKQNGRPFASGVAKSLVDNLRQLRTQEQQEEILIGQYIEPVQLQVVCYQLWQNLKDRPPAPITQEDVNELGNVDAALSQFYEQAIANVLQETGVSELSLRNWFDRQLITEAETRGTVYQGKEETAGLDNRVVQRLANQFLLRAEIRAGGTWFELVHDRFVSPILQANQTWRLKQSPLIRAAEEWDRAGRPRNMLYQGEQLEAALASAHRDSLEPIVQRFLTTSEDAQSQRDLEKTRGQMEEQRQRAEAEARTAQRLRRLTAALVVVFLLAVAAAVYATYEAGRASTNEEIARQNAAEAQQNAALAATREYEAHIHAEAEATSAAEAAANAELAQENANLAATREAEAVANAQLAAQNEADALAARAEAEANAAEAEENAALAAENAARAQQLSRLSLAQSLSSTAPRLIDRTNNTELATLLAVEAYHVNRSLQIELLESVDDSLREILAESYFNIVLEGHEEFVHSAAFSYDGAWLATADTQGTVLLWNLTEPDVPSIALEGHNTMVSAVAFSHDGRWLATADISGLILLWNIASRNAIPLEQHANRVEYLAFTLDNELVSAEATQIVYRWPLANLETDDEFVPERILGLNPVHQIVGFSPDGTLLVTANGFHTLSLWDITLPGVAQIDLYFEGNEAPITSVAFSADMLTLASANEDGTIRVWDLRTRSTVPARIETRDGSSDIALSPDGRLLSTISGQVSDLAVVLWDLSFFKDERRIAPRDGDAVQLGGHTSNIRTVAISPDGLHMVTGGDDMTVRLWDLGPAPAAPLSLDANGTGATAVAVTPDDSLFLVGNEMGEILVWNMADVSQKPENPLAILKGHEGRIWELLVTADGEKLISTGDDGLIQIWSLAPVDDRPLFTFSSGDSPIYGLALSLDSSTLATGDGDGLIHFWPFADILAGEEAEPIVLTGHEGWVDDLAYSPDGQWLASGGFDSSVFLWDISQVQEFDDLANLIPTRLAGHSDNVSAVAFSPAGHYLASGSYDNTVLLHDLEHLDAPAIMLLGHNDYVYDVAFSPDGDFLASSSWDRTIDVWDMQAITSSNASPAPTGLRGHQGQVVGITFNSDGQLLFSASLDGTARVWSAQVDGFVTLACREVHRNLTWQEWQRYLEGDDYRLTCPDLPVHPSYIESAREMARRQEVEQAIARFEHAIALGAELDFDPEAEAHFEAAQGIVMNGLRQAELGNIEAAVNAFADAQTLGEAVEISSEEWQQLCQLGSEWHQTAVVLEACATAVTLAASSEDVTLNQELCRLAADPELTTTMLPACQYVAQSVTDSGDVYQSYQLCQLQNDISQLSTIVTPACDLVASQTHTITVRTSSVGYIASGQGELWSFEGTEGQSVTINLAASVDSLDTYLILIGPDGEVIDENDDFGDSFDSRLEDVALPTAGTYLIVVRGFDESSVGAYTITLQ